MTGKRSLFLLIKSWRVRAALLWLAHTPSTVIAPLAWIGLGVVLGRHIPAWAPPTAGWLSGLLVVATLAGFRLHQEMDKPGIPCRWCDIEFEEDHQ
jgi:apolipoprotein N-acyltransferase